MKKGMIVIEMMVTVFVFAAMAYGQICSYDGQRIPCPQEVKTGSSVEESTMPTPASPAARQYNAAMPRTSMAPCHPTIKQRAVSAGVVAGIGALLGSALVKNRALGAEIGAGAGAAAGAATAKNGACVARQQQLAFGAHERYMAPYNGRIAPASAPAQVSGPSVVIRNINGADEQMLQPILAQALAHEGYTLIDRAAYNGNPSSVDYLLDITVRQINTVNGWNGGGFWQNAYSQYGDQAIGGGAYQVSLSLMPSDGRADSSRIATENVRSVTYENGNGYHTVSQIYGYAGHSYNMNDPQTAAVEEAVNDFFGLH